ncbi:ferredoxin [Parafrankia irregularis]|uniref:Ferredoxin n=1 Tax=Parafrankia irregularis TaxID=795642 RepID=A0A0S4QRS5_9ACTN|nr:ferredoxin [Parafrankia irregularis]
MATPVNPGDSPDLSPDLRVRIDQDSCTGDGLCVQYAPSVFEFDIDGLAYVKNADGELQSEPGTHVVVPLPLLTEVRDAAEQCPGFCIYLEHADGTLEAGGPQEEPAEQARADAG